jgi:hypothetical protein
MSIGNNGIMKILKWRLFHCYLQLRVFFIRKKKKIRFCFLIQELTQWKTESLYQALVMHPRFEPLLAISPSLGYPGAEKELIKYCENKGYEYIWLDPKKTIGEQLKVDLVAHEKPYPKEIHFAHQVDNNRNIPVVFIPYYLSTITENWVVNKRLNLMCWRQFVDNESCKKSWEKVHKLKGLTYRVTGLPVMDDLLTPKDKLNDVWPNKDGRKRIIYAPHHTIADMHVKGIGYSTFLDYCDFMLEMREKYKEKVYFVFKPHPSLRNKLLEYWGEEKTDDYYKKWEQAGNSHVELGEYLSLFKYSDAMIHDCGSFTVEYMYMDNPVMYLVRDYSHIDNMIPYAREAFDLHYKGKTGEDIERFILDVIDEKDPLKEKRARFKEQNLLPPNGKTACENIIDSILGK